MVPTLRERLDLLVDPLAEADVLELAKRHPFIFPDELDTFCREKSLAATTKFKNRIPEEQRTKLSSRSIGQLSDLYKSCYYVACYRHVIDRKWEFQFASEISDRSIPEWRNFKVDSIAKALTSEDGTSFKELMDKATSLWRKTIDQCKDNFPLNADESPEEVYNDGLERLSLKVSGRWRALYPPKSQGDSPPSKI